MRKHLRGVRVREPHPNLKQNVLANYVSQVYVTIIGIVMVPMYVSYMGMEAYGLVGFYAMSQSWFQLLDMGLTPTMSRETARYQGGATDALSLRRLLRTLESIFVCVAVFGVAAALAGSSNIASSWLKVQYLPLREVRNSIMLMGIVVALRWLCGLYRGAITGFERLIWLSGFSIAIASARFVLIIPFFIYVGTTPEYFFAYQLVVAVIEVVLMVRQTYRILPKVDIDKRIAWQWEPLRGVLKFSLSIAFTTSVWVLATQTDKLVLSKLLPLTDYAYFSLAVLLASGVLVISAPISTALLPRLTKLSAEGDEAGLIRLYRNTTQLVGIVTVPTTLVLAFFAEPVLWAWTGNAEIARRAAPVLMLYSLGNGILALTAFPYYLQFAKGDMKLHLTGNALFVVIFIPLLLWSTEKYGMVGAGYAWVIANLIPFMFWLPIVHARFVKGLHTRWLLRDVIPILILPILIAGLIHEFVEWPTTRLQVAIAIAVLSLGLCIVTTASSSNARKIISSKWRF